LEINVSPRRLVSRELTKRLQEGALLDVVDVLDGKGAMLELQVDESSKVAGRTVGDITIPRGATLCALLSSGRVLDPTNDLMVNPGDRLILFTQTDVRQSVERLFKRPLLGR
jgi:trk system potassium uptake protein TrkA